MKGKGIWVGLVASWFLFGCSPRKKPSVAVETPTSGRINVSIDESFQSVMDNQIMVFESSFPNVTIVPHYKSEAECLRDLTTDSTRMVIVTRGLSKEEEKFYVDSFHMTPSQGEPLAYDAIAVVVNKASGDSLFTMKQLVAMLNGTDTKHLPVMDGNSETSTVRYLIDSVLKGKSLGKNVTAAKSSQAVIDYVANNPRAVGFVGMEWIGDLWNGSDTGLSKTVMVAALQCDTCSAEVYVRPDQRNIAWKRYPLVRSLYYILKENFSGVGSNFANFLQYERGQLIFSKAYLWPARMRTETKPVLLGK